MKSVVKLKQVNCRYGYHGQRSRYITTGEGFKPTDVLPLVGLCFSYKARLICHVSSSPSVAP